MTTAHIAFNPDQTPTVILDGTDWASAINGLRIEATAPGRACRLTLDLYVRETALVEGQVAVYMRAETAALLQRAGWTPPADQVVPERMHLNAAPADTNS